MQTRVESEPHPGDDPDPIAPARPRDDRGGPSRGTFDLRRRLPDGRLARAGLALVGLAGIGLAGAAAFGLIHIVGGGLHANPRAVWFGVWLTAVSGAATVADLALCRRLLRSED